MAYQNYVYAGRYPRPDDNLGLPPGVVIAGAGIIKGVSFGPTPEFLERQARRDQFFGWLEAWRQFSDIAPQWKKDLYAPILDQAARMVADGSHSNQPAIDWMFQVDADMNVIERMQLPTDTRPANLRPDFQAPVTAGFAMPSDLEKWLPVIGIAASLFFLLKKG